MTDRVAITNYPLYWPTGWPRTRSPSGSAFGATNVYRETQKALAELDRLRARKPVVSSNLQLRNDGIPYANQRIPQDAGVAVWFWLEKPGYSRRDMRTTLDVDRWDQHVFACDRWFRSEHNLRAIVKHIESIRGQARWGVGSVAQAWSVAQAFAGFKAIPAHAGATAYWNQVLGVDIDSGRETIERAYKLKARSCHPDAGGKREEWDELQVAYRAGLETLGAAS